MQAKFSHGCKTTQNRSCWLKRLDAIFILAFFLLISGGKACRKASAAIEKPVPPSFDLPALRYDDDFSYLCDPSERTGLWESIKYIPLGDDADYYLSLGGEFRERYEAYNNRRFGLTENSNMDVFLHRFLFHGDFHFGKGTRFFGQVGSHFQSGREGGAASTDENPLDLQQGFIDVSFGISEHGRITLRGGRQEIAFGEYRLLSVRESPNVRRSFDGLRAMIRTAGLRIDGFITQTVKIQDEIFDDESNDDEAFWGVYGVTGVPWISGMKADLYYLGLDREDVRYDQGRGNDQRHTIGTRLWGASHNWHYDLEWTYQFGDFEGADIHAWGVATDAGYTFKKLIYKPRLSLRASITSGDKDSTDGELNTFNPPFAKRSYFTQARIVAPSNVISLQPRFDFQLTENLGVTSGWGFLWRESLDDAVYVPPGIPLISSTTSDERFVGHQLEIGLLWRPNRHIDARSYYVHFEPGKFVEDAGGKNVEFFLASVALRF